MYKYLIKHLFSFLLLWAYIYPEEELMSHALFLALIFGGLPDYFPKWLHHFIHRTTGISLYSNIQIFHMYSTFIIISHFYSSNPSDCEVVSHWGFELHFPFSFFKFYVLILREKERDRPICCSTYLCVPATLAHPGDTPNTMWPGQSCIF